MKQILLCSFLISIWAIQAHCFVVDKPNNDTHQSESTLLGKIRNKSVEIAENVYHREEAVEVETSKPGYHVTHYLWHPLSVNIYFHTNFNINHNIEDHAIHQNGLLTVGNTDKPIEVPDSISIQTDRGKIDIITEKTD